MPIPEIELTSGNKIPQVGLGLWQVTDPAVFESVFEAAIQAGYRHFDTAQFYKNEQLVGAAWTKMGLNRKELFITTKVKLPNFGEKRTAKSIDTSLHELRTDYIDLMLLHFPVTALRKKSWRALEAAKHAGKVRAIGVSNYTVRHLEEMKTYATELPAVNQVELHVFLQQPELLEYCRTHHIVVEAYSPLAHGKVMADPVVTEIAKKHGKTYAQIMLRWCVEKDLIVLPKSSTPARVRENLAIFDFTLDSGDMDRLAGLDRGLRTCWDPTHVP